MEGRKAGAGQEWGTRARRNGRARPRESGRKRSVARVEVVRKGGGGRGAAGTGSRQRCEAEKSEGGARMRGRQALRAEEGGARERWRARTKTSARTRADGRDAPGEGRSEADRRRADGGTRARARRSAYGTRALRRSRKTWQHERGGGSRRTKRERMFHVKHSFPDEAQGQTERAQGRMGAIGPNAEAGPSEAIPPNRTQTEQIVTTSLCRKPPQSKRAEAWRGMIWGCRDVAR